MHLRARGNRHGDWAAVLPKPLAIACLHRNQRRLAQALGGCPPLFSAGFFASVARQIESNGGVASTTSLIHRRAVLLGLVATAVPTMAVAQGRLHTVGDRLIVTEPLPLPTLRRSRRLRIYLPPSYATQSTRRYPVIYLHDGQSLFDEAIGFRNEEWGVDETLDGLAARHGFEAIAVGIDNDEQMRDLEYNPWDHDHLRRGDGFAYLEDLVTTIKPAIDAGYRTRPEAPHTALIGSSKGGLITHAGLHRHAQVFGLGAILSPAFWVSPLAVLSLSTAEPVRASQRVFVYSGGREELGNIDEICRMYGEQLAGQTDAREILIWPEAEHDVAVWRKVLPLALRFLYQLPPG
mgnify:CR=1 FL=1